MARTRSSPGRLRGVDMESDFQELVLELVSQSVIKISTSKSLDLISEPPVGDPMSCVLWLSWLLSHLLDLLNRLV